MPSTAEPGKATEKIWDWEVIKALYMGGMETREIVEVPRFRELSLSYLRKRASEQGWKQSREEARAEGTGHIARGLQLKMAEAEEVHQNWLLETLDEERKIFEDTKNKKGGKDQLERLAIISKLDETVRRQLGLDERPAISDQQRNLGILISIQQGGLQPKGLHGQQQIAIAITQGGTPVNPEVAAILQEHQEKKLEGTEVKKPLPPGIREISPFAAKGDLVNEKPKEPDIIDIINAPGTGFHAFEISKGTEGE